jgi:lysophospholipase L1-like esterase
MNKWLLYGGLGLGAAIGGGLLFKSLYNPWKRKPLRFPALVVGDSIAVGTGAALERLSPNPQVGTSAVVGESSGRTLELLESRLDEFSFYKGATTAGDLGEFTPPADVVISTGTNSIGAKSVYEIVEDIEAIIRFLRDKGIRPILIAPPPAMCAQGFSDDQKNDLLGLVTSVELGFLDVLSLWDLLGSEDIDKEGCYGPLGAPDNIHPRIAGYEAIAQALLEGEKK